MNDLDGRTERLWALFEGGVVRWRWRWHACPAVAHWHAGAVTGRRRYVNTEMGRGQQRGETNEEFIRRIRRDGNGGLITPPCHRASICSDHGLETETGRCVRWVFCVSHPCVMGVRIFPCVEAAFDGCRCQFG